MAQSTVTPPKEDLPKTEKSNSIVKPEKPDEAAHKIELAKLETEHKALMAQLVTLRDKINTAKPKKDGPPSPQRQRANELKTQLSEIRKEQGVSKASRNAIQEQIKKLDEKLKSLINEQKTARARTPFKSVDDVDREIARLEKEVDGGQMKLVDERKALTEVSNLRKQRKNFSGFDEQQKKIDEVKAQIKELKDQQNDPATKARSEEYNKLQAELDAIKAEQDEAYKNVSALIAEREKLQKLQSEKYKEKRACQDNFYQAKRAFQEYEFQARQKLRERKKAEQEAYNNAKKRERAEKVLAEASEPAYLDEIRRAQSLVHYFEPSSNKAAAPLLAPSGLSATAARTVTDDGMKGMKLVKKEEEDYFAGTPSKKGKKGRKAANASPTAPATTKFSVPPSVLEDCSAMGIEPPMTAAEVPAVVEKVKAKLDHWKKDQKAQTERNIAKAKKEIEKLDAEDSSPATPATAGSDKDKTVAEKAEGAVAAAAETVKEAVEAVTEKVAELTTSEETKA